MSAYDITEQDIEKTIRYLTHHDPKNADRDYAIQLLQVMQNMAHDLVKADVDSAELLQKALEELSKRPKKAES